MTAPFQPGSVGEHVTLTSSSNWRYHASGKAVCIAIVRAGPEGVALVPEMPRRHLSEYCILLRESERLQDHLPYS